PSMKKSCTSPKSLARRLIRRLSSSTGSPSMWTSLSRGARLYRNLPPSGGPARGDDIAKKQRGLRVHIDHGALAEIRVSVQNQLVGDILQRCPRVDAQRKRIRQHIAHHGLQNRTGDRQTCTDRNAQKQTRQADIPHDVIGGL